MVLVPIALDPGGYFMFLPVKWAVATALVAAGLAALLLGRRGLAWCPAVAAWVALLIVLAAASALGIGGLTSWIGYPGRYLGVIAWATFFGAFVLGASLRDDRDRGVVIRATVGASLVVSVYAILQAFEIDPIDWDENLDVSRTRSTLGNAAFLGAYLAMIVPLAGRLALADDETDRVRTLHAVAALLATVALLTTETRGAWIGAVAGIIAVSALERRRLGALGPRALAAAGTVVALAILGLATVSPWAERVRSITDPSAATGRGRLIQWERTWDLITGRPVLGWGPETYAFAFPPFIDAEFEREVGRAVVPDRAHNVFLDLAATSGVLGVAAYVAVLALLVRAVAQATPRDPTVVALAGACAAYVVQLQFSFPVADVDVVFWLLAGLLVAATAPTLKVVARTWMVAPAMVALAALAWGGAELVGDRLLRDSLDAEAAGNLDEAQRLVDQAADIVPARAQYDQAAARLHVRVGEATGNAADFERGLDALGDARRLVPRDLELAMDRADVLLSWGEVTDDDDLLGASVHGYQSVLRSDPASSRAHLRLGVAYVQLGREDDAEREWLEAASLAPTSSGPLVNLGLLYEQQGRTEEARQALRRAVDLDADNTTARDALRRLES